MTDKSMSISENLVHDGPLRFFSRQEAKVRTYETSTSETKNAIIKPKVVDRVRWVVMCCDVKRPMVLIQELVVVMAGVLVGEGNAVKWFRREAVA